MKKIFVFLAIVLVMSSGSVWGCSQEVTVDIKKVALNYIEGVYEGDAERVKRALHPKLAKRMVFTDAATGNAKLMELTADILVSYIRQHPEKIIPKDRQQIDVMILDVYKNMASVKITSAKYFDYLHMVKWDGEWVILNVVWENK